MAMSVELSQRVGYITESEAWFDYAFGEDGDGDMGYGLVEAAEKAGTFDKLPDRWKKLILQAERELPPRPRG